MATFQAQVESITNIAFGTNPAPTLVELNQYLTDGAKEVINRLSVGAPEKLPLFSTSQEIVNGNGFDIESGLLISVSRADGANASNLEPCNKISSEMKYRATDPSSLDYVSKFNPAYYMLDGKVFILPEPSSGVDKAVVHYIEYPEVLYNHSAIGVSKKIETAVTVTDAVPAVFTCSGSITLTNGMKVKLSNFATSTDYNGVISEVQNVGTDGANKFRVKGLSSSGAGTAGIVETITGGWSDSYDYLVVLYAVAKTFESMAGFFMTQEEDMELLQMVQTNMVTARQEYDKAFGLMAPPPKTESDPRMEGARSR